MSISQGILLWQINILFGKNGDGGIKMKHLFKEIYKQYFLIGQLGKKQFMMRPTTTICLRKCSGPCCVKSIVLDMREPWDIEVFYDADLQNA